MFQTMFARFTPALGVAPMQPPLRSLSVAPFVLAAMLATVPANAQTATPEPAPAPDAAPATGAAPATPTLTPAQQANRDRIKGERETCRAEAQKNGMKGPAMRTAVQDCMAKVDPMAAKRMKCVQAGKAQSLTGDALRKSVRQCMTGA